MKIVILKSRYITDETRINLFEGDLNEFITYCNENFKQWFNGCEGSCEGLAKTVIEALNTSDKNVYRMEVASWFKLISK